VSPSVGTATASVGHCCLASERTECTRRVGRLNVANLEEASNREVDEFRARFEAGESDAIVEYFSRVLDASVYPEGFPQKHRVAFVPESRQLVVKYELPPVSIVPTVRLYRYVRSRDAIEDSARPQAQLRTLYAQAVAQGTLRTIHELFEADRGNHIETIVLNGYVDTIDPATGKAARPHLVTVRASKEASNSSTSRMSIRSHA
jgi:restriction system protein